MWTTTKNRIEQAATNIRLTIQYTRFEFKWDTANSMLVLKQNEQQQQRPTVSAMETEVLFRSTI